MHFEKRRTNIEAVLRSSLNKSKAHRCTRLLDVAMHLGVVWPPTLCAELKCVQFWTHMPRREGSVGNTALLHLLRTIAEVKAAKGRWPSTR
jgi:hypothetical protein